jgi:L-aminopeptidase/D-esterase-like protein
VKISKGADARLGDGFRVGHWTNEAAQTGCTVVLPPLGNVTSVDIRGSSPSTRELAHLEPERKLTEVHGILLTGGSAFGLAAAQGVVDWLSERGTGYQTPLVPIPIVPAAVIFDLAAGDPAGRPGPDGGRSACEAASSGEIQTGRVGVGAGATVGKWAGREFLSPGGVGMATVTDESERVSALAVVNAVGDVVDDNGRVIAGTSAPGADSLSFRPSFASPPAEGTDPAAAETSSGDVPTNTVLAILAIDAALDKRDVRWLAGRGSDGITVAVRPAHTRYDGDVVFAVAAPGGNSRESHEPNLDVLGHLATRAVAAAVRNAVSG